jgi:2-methylisocitrate lyase-like PEP mutase family enzyme
MAQMEKGKQFRALHEREGAFLIPNPWDIGSARILANLGFEALATTSAGYAFSLGQRDSTVSREDIIAHIAAIASATDLPVNADLGNGFGDAPETAAETIRMAAAAGAVGGSIEDATGRAEHPIYELSLAVERIQAAAEVARSLPFDFLLTARAENYLAVKPDIEETIYRLQAYRRAGADVVYAPGLMSLEEITAVVKAVDCPVNVLAALPAQAWNANDLSAAGVKRISVGSALARVAYGSLLRAGKQMLDTGTFGSMHGSVSYRELNKLFPE